VSITTWQQFLELAELGGRSNTVRGPCVKPIIVNGYNKNWPNGASKGDDDERTARYGTWYDEAVMPVVTLALAKQHTSESATQRVRTTVVEYAYHGVVLSRASGSYVRTYNTHAHTHATRIPGS
jgi:hypothetical protein